MKNNTKNNGDIFYLLLIWSMAVTAIVATTLLIYINITHKALNKTFFKQNDTTKSGLAPKNTDDVYIVYEKNKKIVGCDPNDGCEQTTLLTSSGALVSQGYTDSVISLNLTALERIQNEIKNSGVMNKNCAPSTLINNNSSDEYTLNVNGVRKKIQSTGCEDELKKIDFIINEYKTKFCEKYSDCMAGDGGSCCKVCGNPIVTNIAESKRLEELKKINCTMDANGNSSVPCPECSLPDSSYPIIRCINNLCANASIIE